MKRGKEDSLHFAAALLKNDPSFLPPLPEVEASAGVGTRFILPKEEKEQLLADPWLDMEDIPDPDQPEPWLEEEDPWRQGIYLTVRKQPPLKRRTYAALLLRARRTLSKMCLCSLLIRLRLHHLRRPSVSYPGVNVHLSL